MTKYNEKININDRNSLSILLKRIRPNSVILEFGPAAGRMTEFLAKELNCKVYAVEIDSNAAKIAEQFTEKMVVDSIENYNWKEEFKDLKFDYIIFADVLEHLYYPEKVLKNCNEFLKEDGSILVSIPNIAHNAIILNLLKNKFDYSPIGLLDDTHIRFFTKQTFDDMIRCNGYFISFETAIYLEPKNTEFRNNYDEIPELFGEYLAILPWGEVYQYIYEIKTYEIQKVSDFNDEYKLYGNNFAQLFIENEENFSELNSIKLPVLQNNQIQKFEFDLKDKKNIKSLRLDPLNDSCIIKIEKLYLLQEDLKEVDLMSHISANTCAIYDNNYFFDKSDPQVYFINLDLGIFNSVKKLHFEVIFNSVSKDALHECINQIQADNNDKISILEVANLNLQESLFSMSIKSSDFEKELISIYNSKSWKITRPLRKLSEKIKNLKQRYL